MQSFVIITSFGAGVRLGLAGHEYVVRAVVNELHFESITVKRMGALLPAAPAFMKTRTADLALSAENRESLEKRNWLVTPRPGPFLFAGGSCSGKQGAGKVLRGSCNPRKREPDQARRDVALERAMRVTVIAE